MPRRLLLPTLCIASTICLAATADAGQAARAATVARPAAPAADPGYLAPPIREEPTPVITSLKGVGTANAVAEARMTPQILKEFCSERAQSYQSTAQCMGPFANNP